MMTFSPEAQELFDRYLQTVRWSVRGVSDPDEIERDVREHVASALEEQEGPVSSMTLRAVLAKLGDPWQWIPLEELPWWKRLLMRFSLSPDDWRLAYVCFALTIVGFLLIPIGGFVLLIGAYLLARASYDLANERESALGARRWLIYPALAVFSLILASMLLIALPVPIIAWGVDVGGFQLIFDHSRFNLSNETQEVAFQVSSALVVTGVWWVVLSAIVALAIRPLRWLFVPFANRMRRAHALWLTGAGAVVGGAGVAMLLRGV